MVVRIWGRVRAVVVAVEGITGVVVSAFLSEPVVEGLVAQVAALRGAVAVAADRQVTAVDSDGWLRVVSDGTPRLVKVEINPRLFRRSSAEICSVLAEVIDEALSVARQSSGESLTAALPSGLRRYAQGRTSTVPADMAWSGQDRSSSTASGPVGGLAQVLAALPARLADMDTQAREIAGDRFEGSAGGGAVVVTLSGHGRVRGVRLGRDVVNKPDSKALAGHVIAATNEGLSRLRERWGRLTGMDVDAGGEVSLDGFLDRIGELNARLDAVLAGLNAHPAASPS